MNRIESLVVGENALIGLTKEAVEERRRATASTNLKKLKSKWRANRGIDFMTTKKMQGKS